MVEKFATEARAIAKIDNENVLKIYDVGLEGEQHFLVMELLDGESILDLITREGRLEPLDALRVARQAANGLAAAHAQGIIHRDVKPENLVLLEDGTVKLVDFGLAVGDDAGSQRVGTPHYMAPEICEDGQAEPERRLRARRHALPHADRRAAVRRPAGEGDPAGAHQGRPALTPSARCPASREMRPTCCGA